MCIADGCDDGPRAQDHHGTSQGHEKLGQRCRPGGSITDRHAILDTSGGGHYKLMYMRVIGTPVYVIYHVSHFDRRLRQ